MIEIQLKALECQFERVWRARVTLRVGLSGTSALATVRGKTTRVSLQCAQVRAAPRGTCQHVVTEREVNIRKLSKHSARYLHPLQIYGVRSAIHHPKDGSIWVARIIARRPLKLMVAALATKKARASWAMVAHGWQYQVSGTALAA